MTTKTKTIEDQGTTGRPRELRVTEDGSVEVRYDFAGRGFHEEPFIIRRPQLVRDDGDGAVVDREWARRHSGGLLIGVKSYPSMRHSAPCYIPVPKSTWDRLIDLGIEVGR